MQDGAERDIERECVGQEEGIDEHKADILVPLFACILCILPILCTLCILYYTICILYYIVPSTGPGSLPARHLFVWLGV